MYRSTDSNAKCMIDEIQKQKFPKALSFPQICPKRHLPTKILSMAHGITSKPTKRSATASEITAWLFAIFFSASIFVTATITIMFPTIVATLMMIIRRNVTITALKGHNDVTKRNSLLLSDSAQHWSVMFVRIAELVSGLWDPKNYLLLFS